LPLAQPPRDAGGQVSPHDHDGILAAHGVIRRISPYHMVPDEKSPTGRRISSAAFQASKGENAGMSVDLEQSIIDAGADPKEYVLQPPFIGAVRFIVGQLRNLGFRVGFDPLPTNPHHGEVWGTFNGSNKKKLSEIASPYIDPVFPEQNP
jgi:hypothetical protein